MSEQFDKLIISTNSGYYMADLYDYKNSIYYIHYLKNMAYELLERTDKMLSKIKYADKKILKLEEIPKDKEKINALINSKIKIIIKNKLRYKK